MRRLGVIVLALLFTATTAGCTVGGSSVALVNPSRLFQDSASGKAGIAHLKNMENSMQEQLQAAQKLIEKRPGDENLRMLVQQEFASYQQLVNSEQQKVVDGLNTQIKMSLDNVRAQKKLGAIFSSETALSYDAKLDVTDDVLAEMDRTPLEFAPATITPIEDVIKQAQNNTTKAPKEKK